MKVFTEGDNPKDPLKRAEEAQLELTKRFAQSAGGFANEVVIGAAINLLVNAIRQSYPRLADADARYAELTGKFRSILISHYDSVTGRRRSIFPFNQVISPALFNDRDKINKH